MKFMNPYFSVKQRIETLERWILVHSYLYYELDKSIVDDRKFDKNALQLVELIKHNGYEAKASSYYYVFKDFDGTTGFDLFKRLNGIHQRIIMRDADYILQMVEVK